jgi:hypothetical protein
MRCLFGAAAIVVATAGCSAGQDKSAAEAGVVRFREMLAAQRYDDIHAAADPELQRAGSKESMIRVMRVIRERVGTVRTSELTSWRVNFADGGNLVELQYRTQFSSGPGAEQFMFRVNGSEAKLVAFNYNSPALLEALTAAPGPAQRNSSDENAAASRVEPARR